MNTAIHTVERFFVALEAGDIAALTAIYSEDARIWHNFTGGEQGVADNLQVLRGLHQVVAGLRYEIVRRISNEDGVFQQHVLRGRLPDGSEIAMPAAMYLAVTDGQIRRIEEYLDSAQAAKLGAVLAGLVRETPP